jgi:hypothetical protein
MPSHNDLPEASGHQSYSFVLNGASHHSQDREMTARDILNRGGFFPASDHILIQLLHPGSKSVGLDELIDLAGHRSNDFWAALSDRVFMFTVDELGYEWAEPKITETQLRQITGLSDDRDFELERRDAPDQIIGEGEALDLGAAGTEHIRTVPAFTTIIVNAQAHKVAGKQISFEALVKLAFEVVPTGPDILITVDYGKGPKENPKGSLKAGQSVKIKNGMVFDVVATDRS